MYRIFIDEFGHDNLRTADRPTDQYLCVLGVVLELEKAHKQLTYSLDEVKKRAFGTSEIVLHRRELIDKKPPFERLCDKVVQESFSNDIMNVIENGPYSAICVLIDKKEHRDRYRKWRFQPYHYCLTAMLERYVMLLDGVGGVGDVMAEWRGIGPNRKLEKAYEYAFKHGTDNLDGVRMRNRLSSGKLKIEKKTANVAGLQLADLLVNPAARDLICQRTGEQMTAPYGLRIVKCLKEAKYHRNWRGVVKGCGTKMLP